MLSEHQEFICAPSMLHPELTVSLKSLALTILLPLLPLSFGDRGVMCSLHFELSTPQLLILCTRAVEGLCVNCQLLQEEASLTMLSNELTYGYGNES